MLKIISNWPDAIPTEEVSKLQRFCLEQELALTLEWLEGQYWLHSDEKGELPIGIQVDQTLERHLQYFKKSSLHKEQLARALGIKGSYRPQVLDLTAGLLGDSLLFLSMGCKVTALERHPVVAFLIKSALENAHHPLLNHLQFQEADAQTYLKEATSIPEVIYFDPMFEDVNDKALPKKEMRIFRSLLGQDRDAVSVLETALKRSPKRLVVKRPRLSKYLREGIPLTYVGKSTRYDVYLGQNHGPNDSNQIK